VFGALLGCGAGVLFGMGHLNLGGWAVLLGGAADVLDGRIARAQGVAGTRGAFLDSTLDRFAEVGAFVGLAVFFQASTPALVAVTAGLGGSLLVSYARARGESVGVVCKVGVMQRAERLLLVGFGGILDPAVCAAAGWERGTLLLALVSIVAVGTVGTAIYRTVWIAKRLD
jgi:CDP-diacylglycerol--glycerol-3-phosphate 3-phosphatidyltransferase